MPYSDLLSDAHIVFPLNNSITPTLHSGTAVQNAWTGNHVFVQDAPTATGNTHSLRMNNYASDAGYYTFSNTNFPFNDAITFTGWIKIKTLVPFVKDVTNQGGIWNLVYHEAQFSSWNSFRLPMGIYRTGYSNYNERQPECQWNGGLSNQVAKTYASLGKIELDRWHHVAMVIRNQTGDIGEMALYIDGSCVQYQFDTTWKYDRMSWNVLRYPWLIIGTNTNNQNLMSNAAFWNRALTIDEIRAQAWYGHENEDYVTKVLADNPTYLAMFDNPDKTTNHSVYGATDWGSLSDDVSAITVNDAGPFNTKSWKFGVDSNQVNTYTINNNANMMAGMSNLMKSGEFSIEFWVKQSSRPTAQRPFLGIQNTAGNYPNGFWQFRIDDLGRIQFLGSYKNGATTYTQGSILGVSIDAPTGTQTTLTMHPGDNVNNWADNKWHHVIYTFSKTDGGNGAGLYTGYLYVDGCRVGTRNWTNTYGWLDGTSSVSQLELGSALTSLTLRDTNITAFAMYPYRLQEYKIWEHFKVGKDYVSELGSVKYYNGTSWITATPKVWNGSAWVDWVKKYWNGTAWTDLP